MFSEFTPAQLPHATRSVGPRHSPEAGEREPLSPSWSCHVTIPLREDFLGAALAEGHAAIAGADASPPVLNLMDSTDRAVPELCQNPIC
jgi:hypothetical protein